MKIIFTKEEILDILKRETDVIISNYHVGEFSMEIDVGYMNDVTVEVELKEYVPEVMDESDILTPAYDDKGDDTEESTS